MVLEDTAVREAVAARRKVAPTKLAHIVFRTAAKQPMLDWYREVLDGEIVFDNAFIGFITYDDEHHRVAVIQMPDIAPPERVGPGLHHIAFTYANLDDLLHTYERLRESGIKPAWCINHGPTTSMYYSDPDDNKVELQIDNFPSMAEATAWLHSPAFAENPIGVDFDPEKLLADYRRGVPETELKKRPNIGPRGLPPR